MNRILSLIFLVLLFAGCTKDDGFEPSTPNAKYELIIENGTHSDIDVWCNQINGVAHVELKKDEKTDVLTAPIDVIEIKYFGAGTYYKQKETKFKLKENEINVLKLELAP